MMDVPVIWVETVSVCAQLLLPILMSVHRKALRSNGGATTSVVSLYGGVSSPCEITHTSNAQCTHQFPHDLCTEIKLTLVIVGSIHYT